MNIVFQWAKKEKSIVVALALVAIQNLIPVVINFGIDQSVLDDQTSVVVRAILSVGYFGLTR